MASRLARLNRRPLGGRTKGWIRSSRLSHAASYIHHYTSVETLALILSSRRIRFRPLDRMDDIREAQTQVGIQFGKYFFASCWTLTDEESIPQWNMYTDDMTGVRLSLPEMPFRLKRLDPSPAWGMTVEGDIWSPLSFDEIFGEGHFVLPMFLRREHFAAPVRYVDDVETHYREAIRLSRSLDGEASLTISRPFDLVCLKGTHWRFQAEYRFFLFILPSLPVPPSGPGSSAFSEALPNHLLKSMLTGTGPGVDHVDLELSDEALAHVRVTTGPLSTEATRRRVDELLEVYAPSGNAHKSALAGNIRSRKA